MDETNINPENQLPENSPDNDTLSEPQSEESASVTDSSDSESNPKEGEKLPNNSETIEENSSDAVSMPRKKTEQSAYTYRWDYHTQHDKDKSYIKANTRKGKKLYVAVFASAILVSLLLLVGVLLCGNIVSTGHNYNFASISEVYDECLPSYVAIHVETPTGEGVGSGIVLTSDGYISTNYHVVADATTITVITSDDSTYEAKLLDGDEINDIAVIKVEARGLHAAKIGSSANSRVGDQVMAIGTPYSINYKGTMTSGYISALNRRFVEENANGTVSKVMYMIQTDTSVNPGNSGGPLFNMNGEVIGIVSLKISGNNYEGLGFAIPIESVTDIIEDIMEHGKITQTGGGAHEGAALGISGYEVKKDTKYFLYDNYHFTVQKDEASGEENVVFPGLFEDVKVSCSDTTALKNALAEYLSSTHSGLRPEDIDVKDFQYFKAPENGICVVSLTNGFDIAEKLKINDIIVYADGISCAKMTTLKSLIADKKTGDEILFTICRDGKMHNIKVILGKASDMSD